ncbi:MAG: ArsR family transcriptional regulator [Flavobacteriaceae bacterium]|nr:ArsR family transcriptional regulator [Flavobacteriaceae bacterium]
MNGLATEFNESTNSIRKELNHLSQAGYLEKYKDNNKVAYKANTSHPLFDVLQKVVFKHLGLEQIIERVLERMGSVKKILLIGDYAKGLDSGNVEVILIGDQLNTEYIEALEIKVQSLIDRKVTFYLASKENPNQNSILIYENI